MAKAILTFTDEGGAPESPDGREEDVNVDVELDPKFEEGMTLEDLSQAQQMALGLILVLFPEDGEDVIYKSRNSSDDES